VLFGATLPQAEAYASLLAGPGIERGLIGPAEAGRIWDRHLINCGLVYELLASCPPETIDAGEDALRGPVSGGQPSDRLVDGQLADLGSGAGLPGIVLAILRPDLRVTLIEPMARRTVFLAECVAELGLRNVKLCSARAEELAGEVGVDVVTSRAVARLDRLAELATGLARPGGLVLGIKGASAKTELAGADPVLRRLGITEAEVVTAGDELVAKGLIDQPTTVVRFRTARSGRVVAGRSRGGAGQRPRR
jgi:16S rRNA (guanine527-N7)-methyltransferase